MAKKQGPFDLAGRSKVGWLSEKKNSVDEKFLCSLYLEAQQLYPYSTF
jgi:hypothetical protein